MYSKLILNFSFMCKSVWFIQGAFYFTPTYLTFLVIKKFHLTSQIQIISLYYVAMDIVANKEWKSDSLDAKLNQIRGAHRSCFWSIFDSFFICFCRHRSSKMKSKMRCVNLTSLEFSKMSEKCNNMFFGTLAALNSTAHCRLCFILSLSEYYLSASNFPRVFTNYSLVY